MSETVSLTSVIDEVLAEKGIDKNSAAYESSAVSLKRSFDRFFQKIGCDKGQFKEGRIIKIGKREIYFVKTILSQFYNQKGVLFDYVKSTSEFNLEDTLELIESFVAEAAKDGATPEEQEDIRQFIDNMLIASPRYEIERCHTLINLLNANLQDLRLSEQAMLLREAGNILEKMFLLRIADLTTHIIEITGEVEGLKENADDGDEIQIYHEFEILLMNEFILRDREILRKIQTDDDLRYYIEKLFGRKAEEIYNHAAKELIELE